MSFTPFMVQTSCGGKKEAEKIAKILIECNLAACVQVSEIESFYRWEKELCEDKEYLLTIKTKKENYKRFKANKRKS